LVSSCYVGGTPLLTTVGRDHETLSGTNVNDRSQLSPTNREWMPTPEQILEITTSKSKPLMALERLRRISLASAAADITGPRNGNTGRGRRRCSARKRKGGGGSVGMMDLFAIMAQINEQLGAADNLDTFLGVVVGVIKDLTQFHRVTVFQFDDAWNSQVVSELVDWSQTHDLYRGLHFPAGDISTQVTYFIFSYKLG